MSVAQVAVFPTIEEFLGNRVSSWHWQGAVTGVAGGGTAEVQFPVQSSGQDIARYFVLVDWGWFAESAAAARLTFTDLDEWIDYQLFTKDGAPNRAVIAQMIPVDVSMTGVQANKGLTTNEIRHKPIYIGRPLPLVAANLGAICNNADTVEFSSTLVALAFRFKPDALHYAHFGSLNPLVK